MYDYDEESEEEGEKEEEEKKDEDSQSKTKTKRIVFVVQIVEGFGSSSREESCCRNQWYHIRCIKMKKKEPEDIWYCCQECADLPEDDYVFKYTSVLLLCGLIHLAHRSKRVSLPKTFAGNNVEPHSECCWQERAQPRNGFGE